MLVRLLYVSRAVDKDCSAAIESILHSSRNHNLHHGITGILCYGGGVFLQAIEGGREAVNKLFASLPQGLLKPHETQDLRALLDEATAQTRTKQPKRWVLTAAVEQLRSLAVRVATEAITKAAADYLLILLGAALAKMM